MEKSIARVLLQKIPEEFNVFNLIQEMRTQRHSAVQTKVILSSERCGVKDFGGGNSVYSNELN